MSTPMTNKTTPDDDQPRKEWGEDDNYLAV
jgi:hypothetical protein